MINFKFLQSKMIKSLIYIILLLVLVTFFVLYVHKDFFAQKSKPHNIMFDKYTVKQWYLYDHYHANIETYSSSKIGRQGFNTNKILRIDSDFNLGIYSFWNKGITCLKNKEITIALIDTCIDISHEDLCDNIWKNNNEIPNDGIDNDNNGYIDDCYGWNFIDNCKIVDKDIDEYSHGTHCAGVIAAEHNHIGTMGIAGNTKVKIMVLPAIERGDNDVEIYNVINAIQYAERMGAQICNLSCTFSSYSKDLENAIKYSNMYFVVAAGNYENGIIQGLNLDENKRFPASFNFANVITVGSLDMNCDLSSFSNYGSHTVDISAPGEFIYSTLPNNTYGFLSGTSMATPIVTSVLALYYLYNEVNLPEAVNMLYQNANHSNSLSEKIVNGRILYFDY